MPKDEPVTRASFSDRLQPIVVPRPLSLLPGRVWSDEEWECIRLGYSARDMDEKWNVFAEGNVVHLHRSWTGHGVVEATFTPLDSGGRQVTEAVVERDGDRYSGTDDAYDCLMLELVLSAIVLGEPAQELRARLVERVRGASGREDVPAGIVLHSALGLRSGS
ncbi:hypothetical protein AB4039_11480 [Streptomyces sp. M-16]|uniref:hypothetical protein n=1 Tax=Streptomyces sp. M-16 TaxID=3233040 RepID=UPI003F966B09